MSIVVVDALSQCSELERHSRRNGTWSANVGRRWRRRFTITASVDDGAGNTSTDSETGVIDTLAPSVEMLHSSSLTTTRPLFLGLKRGEQPVPYLY